MILNLIDKFNQIYLEIDKDVIRLLYHPKMKIGVDRYEVDNLLREILLGEK